MNQKQNIRPTMLFLIIFAFLVITALLIYTLVVTSSINTPTFQQNTNDSREPVAINSVSMLQGIMSTYIYRYNQNQDEIQLKQEQYELLLKQESEQEVLSEEIDLEPIVPHLVEFPVLEVEHVFTHCLVAFPELELSLIENSTYDIDCLTVSEFKKILQGLYDNNYILINANDLLEATEIDGKTVHKLKEYILLPEGKKGLILSIDDMVYDKKKRGRGMVDKLIIKDDKFYTYTKMKDGSEVISDDNDIVPILDNFVAEHPDFSNNSAKACLALTGFDGILGYKTYLDSTEYDRDIIDVKPVIEMLKSNGYYFGSHSYAHSNHTLLTFDELSSDLRSWQTEVASLVDDSLLYFYPYGAWTRNWFGDIQQLIINSGFKFHFGVGAKPFISSKHTGPKENLPEGVIFMDRRPLDGLSLRKRRQLYLNMFDSKAVYDNDNRYIKWSDEFD